SKLTNRGMERQPDSVWRDFMDSFYLRALGRLGVGAPDRGRIWRATPDNLVSLARQLMGQRAGTLAHRRRRVSAAALMTDAAMSRYCIARIWQRHGTLII